MGRKSKKVVALLLALLMVFSVCSPISGGAGLGSTSAKAGNSAQPATASDAEESEKGITPLANPNGLTLSDFEKHLSSVGENVESRKSSMHQKQTRLKELQQLMEDAKTYAALKPVLNEMKKEKYRFTKAKEKYKAEHESELRRFYMVKRKLKESGFEKDPFPLDAWQKEFSELSAQREAEYQEYKLLQKDLTMLYQIKGDVDQAMRETHPEMLHPNKAKETETAL